MELNPHFIKPLYDSTCFSSLPQNIKYFLTGRGSASLPSQIPEEFIQPYETVIFFFIDSLGWQLIEKHYEHSPFLKHLIAKGAATKITSQYPSTTAAHVTAIHTGLEVGQSGIFEWQFYEPQLDQIIVPLLFSYGGTMKRDTLKPSGIDPKQLFPIRSIYQDLLEDGISSHVFQHREYTPSTFSNLIFEGAKAIPYFTLTEALVNLEGLLQSQKPQTYLFLYFDRIDTICHFYGPNSPQLEAEIETFLNIMDQWFERLHRQQLKNTLFMMTADHGQMAIDPQTTLYLNRDPLFSGFEQYIQTNRKGELLIPGGSCRNLVLYIKEEKLEEAEAFLKKRLEGRAEVYQTQDLIEEGLYGTLPPSPTFHSRVGNLVILPLPHESVWWYEKGKYEQILKGQHGGLSSEEMEIPLFLYNFEA